VAVEYLITFIENVYLHGLEMFGRYYSSYRGIVIDNDDPDMKGGIVVSVPEITGNDALGDLAYPKSSAAGPDEGFFHVPPVGAGIWIEFEGGNIDEPLYAGGWWAKEEGGGTLETPAEAQLSPPTTKVWKTTAGHLISFNDKAGEYQVTVQWHDPDNNLDSFVVINEDGSIHLANHQGTFLLLNAKSGEEGATLIDKHGNTYASDKDGIKLIQADGTYLSLTEDTVHLVGKNLVVSGEAANLSVGGVTLGQGATQPLVLGNFLKALWTQALGVFTGHTHVTPAGPSGPPVGAPWPTFLESVLSLKNKTV
jgi:hypothetical protein